MKIRKSCVVNVKEKYIFYSRLEVPSFKSEAVTWWRNFAISVVVE